jgi:hypothetical protein
MKIVILLEKSKPGRPGNKDIVLGTSKFAFYPIGSHVDI